MREIPAETPPIKKSAALPVVLVAGGAGFLGSRLSRRLLETDCRVVVLDNLTTGKRSHIEELLSHPRFTFIEADINAELPSVLESVDYIFHLASLEAHRAPSKRVGFNSLLTNALGTRNLLLLAKNSPAKFLLASSLEVYRGVLSSEDLTNYFGDDPILAQTQTIAEGRRFAEALTWEFFADEGLDARIVRLGEVYGPGIDLADSGNFGRLVRSSLSGKDLEVYGEGLETAYYTHVDDVVSGLVKALFGVGTRGKIYPLTSTAPTTPLELVYLIKEITSGSTRVVFKPASGETKLAPLPPVDDSPLRELGWGPKISLKEGLSELLNVSAPSEDKASRKVHLSTAAPQPFSAAPAKPTGQGFLGRLGWPKVVLPSFTFRRKIAIFVPPLILLLWFVVFPSSAAVLNLNSGLAQLSRAEEAFAAFDFDAAGKQATSSERSFTAAARNVGNLGYLSAIFGRSGELKATQNTLTAAAFFSSSLGHSAAGLKLAGQFISGPLGKDSPGWDASSAQLSSSELALAQDNILLAENRLKKTDPNLLPGPAKPLAARLGAPISALKANIPPLKSLVGFAPALLGANSPQIYILLFSDSNELRPGAGTYVSYGRISWEKGRISEVLVDDVAALDGLLEAKNVSVEPPAWLKENLGIGRLSLRDAGFEPDFGASASQFQSLYQLATGETAAAVLAVDLAACAKLLAVTGPLFLPQLNESVTEENFLEKVEFYSEGDSSAATQTKKTFLSLFAAKLLETLMRLDAPGSAKLSRVVGELLPDRHLLVYQPQEELAKLWQNRLWDGKIRTDRADYLMAVDANVGATKANYYVKRNLSYAVRNSDREGDWEATATVSYVHSAASNAWPGGAYKNYLRLLTPSGSILKKVTKSSEGVDSKDLDITGEAEVSEISGRRSFGTAFTLDAGKTLTLTFTYQLPEDISLTAKSPFYSLIVQKQPGTLADPLTVDVLTPFGKTMVKAPEGSKRVGNLWRYSGSLRRDNELTFFFE